MTSHEIRRAFLEFFEARKHRIVPSSPLVLPNDPTLLFVNAGMVQFKDLFTGREKPQSVRATSSQKCLRVSGKHNDLERVGRTPRHHTFFEMLGNFSFGDYFKRDAIAWAWELVTEVYGIPEDRLWISVFGGTDSVPGDEEAYAIWRDEVGVSQKRILRLGEKDNFWRMGETGPCGPCSEIYYDLGEAYGSTDGASTPETDEGRYLEIWNLVFMQFEQLAGGGLEALPAPSIDTGMGLERLAAVLQHKASNYDTDVFSEILAAAAQRAGIRYGEDDEADFSLRVIADHARAFCFLVADGVIPANDRRGYVLRRLLRRAIRHGRKLGLEGPFLKDVTPVVIEGLSDVYPELLEVRDAILDIGAREERRFSETLATGMVMLEGKIDALPTKPGVSPILPGKELFRLHDTFGFPLDLARDIAEERGVELDEAGFDAAMKRQREKAQASWKQAHRAEAGPLMQTLAQRWKTSFDGYEHDFLDGVPVQALVADEQEVDALGPGQEGLVVLESTPFYAEAGGQVADHGVIASDDGRATVIDVQRPAGDLVVHRVRVDSGRLQVGEPVHAEIDEGRRTAIRRNHTATHLLHAALREVVGTHVKQAGSRVDPRHLRFDYSHFAPLSESALADVEALVYEQVLADTPVVSDEMEIDEALGRGAMALFGEKYGSQVRVVEIGKFSLELCGGTHCSRTGEIGLVKLTQERGVASGTRRVEAISGAGSLARFREEHSIVRALEDTLSVPRSQLLEEFSRRMDQVRELQKELERQRLSVVRDQLSRSVADAEDASGVKVLAQRLEDVAPQEMRELADSLRQKLGSGVVVLGRADAGKASLLVAVTEDLKSRLPAGDIVRTLARIIGGGGGGRPDLAEAGGKDASRLDEALAAAVATVSKRLEQGES